MQEMEKFNAEKMNQLNKITNLIDKIFKYVPQSLNLFNKLESQVQKNKSQTDQVFKCKNCPKVFSKVNQRSAHMNAHKNQEKKKAKAKVEGKIEEEPKSIKKEKRMLKPKQKKIKKQSIKIKYEAQNKSQSSDQDIPNQSLSDAIVQASDEN